MKLTRYVAALTASLALSIAAATPAAASPEDGKGCAGLPAIPQSYVCVISTTPQNAVPSTTTTTVPVPVPRICYVADCVGPTTVDVPVPGLQPGSGAVAVLWYQGVYYPIAVGTVPDLTLLQPYVTLVTNTAAGAVTTATSLAGTAMTIAFDAVDDAGALGDTVIGIAVDTAEPWVTAVMDLVNDPPNSKEIRDLVIDNTIGQETYGAITGFVEYCSQSLAGCLGFAELPNDPFGIFCYVIVNTTDMHCTY